MLKPLKNNENGVVFVTVLMIIIIMMVLAVTILSLNTSQIMTSESEFKRVQAEILAQGALDFLIINQLSDSAGNYISYTKTIGSTDYDVTINLDQSGTGIFGTDPVFINVDYN